MCNLSLILTSTTTPVDTASADRVSRLVVAVVAVAVVVVVDEVQIPIFAFYSC